MLRLHSRRGEFGPLLEASDQSVAGDISDLESAQAIVRGARTVVHLAGESRAHATWEDVLRPNIIGTQAIFEAARLEGVARVVFASSSHVTGQYDLAEDWPIHVGRPLAPDGPYAVSKVVGEALGAYYSWAFGLSVVSLRIGWVLESTHDAKSERLWLSPRDLVHLVDRCIQADIGHGTFYGISAQVPARYDLTDARARLGYVPIDGNSEMVGRP